MRAGTSPAHGMRIGGELQWFPKTGYNLWSDMIASRYTEACRSGETGGLLFSNIF